MSKTWMRSQGAILATGAAALFALTVASRIPFVSQALYAWDSANFALALDRYNVAFEQPHAPGYPLYVALGWIANLWFRDANASYVFLSVVMEGGAVAALFLLASRMYDKWTGVLSSILLAVGVGFWGYGEVAYPYPALAFFGALIAWLCYLMWQGSAWLAVLSGLILGIAGGVRPDILLFLGPLWLLSVWRAGLARLLASVVVLLLVVGAWFYSAVQLTGGLAAYQQASTAQSAYILSAYSVLGGGFDAVRRNLETALLYLKQMFGLGLAITVYFLGRFLTFKTLVADRRLPFLLLWFLPPVAVYLLVHIGDPGYVLSILPPLCMVTALGIRDIALDARSALLLLSARYQPLAGLGRFAQGSGTALAVAMVAGLVAWNFNAFVYTPGPARLVEIRTIDSQIAGQVKYARAYSPGAVVVIAKARYRQFKYYLPEYNVKLLYDEYRQGYLQTLTTLQVPEGVSAVLVMDFGKQPAQFPGVIAEEVVLGTSPDIKVWLFGVRPGDTVQYGYDYFAAKGRN